MMLPASLGAALGSRLEGVSRKHLAARAKAISERYRGGAPSSLAIRDGDDALAYAVARMPATYAAVSHVLGRLGEHWPDFAPVSLLDLGAGPGTATFAAAAHWASVATATQIERHPEFRSLASGLAAEAFPELRLEVRAADTASALVAGDTASLAVISYALVEMEEAPAIALATRAFASARDALILIEPGTPAGFARIRAARSALIAAGARIVAPCPGGVSCPIRGADWCHFSVRLARSRDHKLLKSADVPFEDERFSYLVATRSEVPAHASRILSEPIRDRSAVTLTLCTETGLAIEAVPRSDKTAYKRAAKTGWGDTW